MDERLRLLRRAWLASTGDVHAQARALRAHVSAAFASLDAVRWAARLGDVGARLVLERPAPRRTRPFPKRNRVVHWEPWGTDPKPPDNQPMITDAILEEVSRLECITTLIVPFRLRSHSITDRGLGMIARLRGLGWLSFQDLAAVTNAGLRALATLEALEALNLSGNVCFDHAGLRALRLPRLRILALHNLTLKRATIAHFADHSPELRYLGLRNSIDAERTLEPLSRLARLEALDIQECGINDAGLRRVARISTLRQLDLHDNEITDRGLASLAALPALKSLDLSSNQELTDAALERLGDLPTLTRLDIRNTNITPDGVRRLRRRRPRLRIEHGSDPLHPSLLGGALPAPW